MHFSTVEASVSDILSLFELKFPPLPLSSMLCLLHAIPILENLQHPKLPLPKGMVYLPQTIHINMSVQFNRKLPPLALATTLTGYEDVALLKQQLPPAQPPSLLFSFQRHPCVRPKFRRNGTAARNVGGGSSCMLHPPLLPPVGHCVL